jgi:hypothetical protein
MRALTIDYRERRLSDLQKTNRDTPDEATIIAWGLFGFILVSAITMIGLYIGFRH